MNEFVITVQYEGTDASNALNDIVISLRNRIKQLSNYVYSPDVDKFKLFIGVSGEMGKFKESNGCHNLRLMRKKRYVTVDIILHRDIWGEGKKASEYFLKEQIIEAYSQMIYKIKKNKLIIEDEKLLNDLKSKLDF